MMAGVINVIQCFGGYSSSLDQKSVTASLDLRSKAAHGHYTGI